MEGPFDLYDPRRLRRARAPGEASRTAMSKIPATIILAVGALLLVGCAGDDTVNPVPPPDASTSDASKDAAADADASGVDASVDAADAASSTTADSGPDATPTDAAPDGD